MSQVEFLQQRVLVTLCVVFLSFFFIHSAVANSAVSDEELSVYMKDGDIVSFIRWMAALSGKNYVIDPRVKGKINVEVNSAINHQEAEQLFRSALALHGFAVSESDGVLTVAPESIIRQGGVASNYKVSASRPSDLVIKVIKPIHANAGKLAQLIKPMMSRSAMVSAWPESNTIIIADRSDNVSSAEQLIAKLDGEQAIEVDVLNINYANAKKTLELIKSMLPQAGGELNPAKKVVLAVDERSNNILVSGDPALREFVKSLVKKLDKLEESQGDTRVIYIHYLKASEVAALVQAMSDSLRRMQKNVSTDAIEVSIQANDSTNALVVTAPPKMMKTIRQVVRELDIRRAQVLVEAVIVEVSDDGLSEIGVQWSTSDSAKDGDGWLGGSRFSSGQFIKLDQFPESYGTGLTLGFYRNGSLRALVTAIATDDTANLLSTPTLVTMDNEEAKIVVGQNVPFVTGSTTNASSGTDNPFQTIERKDVGLSLTVRPQVNEGDAVSLEVFQETSSVTNIDGATDIVTNKRSIKTRVLVEDGDTLVLGGLISDEYRNSEQKVPLLGDIPVFGRLFRSEKITNRKKNLMVFLKPTILRNSVDVDRVTKKRYNFIQGQEEFYGASLKELIEGQSRTIPVTVK